MHKTLLLLTILALSSCANENYGNAPIMYGPLPVYDNEVYNDGYTYDRDDDVQEGELEEITPFDADAARVSRELEEAQQEREKRTYKKLVPNSYDDAFHN